MKKLALYALCAAAIAFPALAQAPKEQEEKEIFPNPNEIVDKAEAKDWVAIAPSDLLVMDLAADAQGNPRRVVIQLMPPPFSQGWIGNMRKLAKAHWWDGTAIVRVQDNYVTQWGDPDGEDEEKAKKLPEGLEVMGEGAFFVTEAQMQNFDDSAEVAARETKQAITNTDSKLYEARNILADPNATEEQHEVALTTILGTMGLDGENSRGPEPLDVTTTKSKRFPEGWHERDSYAEWTEIALGWPIANVESAHWVNDNEQTVPAPSVGDADSKGGPYKVIDSSIFWPVHCYGMVGVGRGYSPDTGTGAELYTVIGHAPRHLDRNIALVGRIIEGMEHLSSLPRGTGPLGFYETPEERTAIQSVRLMSDMVEGTALPEYEYLSTESAAFAKYADARANRRDPFFIQPAGGADICNIPVPVRRVKAE